MNYIIQTDEEGTVKTMSNKPKALSYAEKLSKQLSAPVYVSVDTGQDGYTDIASYGI